MDPLRIITPFALKHTRLRYMFFPFDFLPLLRKILFCLDIFSFIFNLKNCHSVVIFSHFYLNLKQRNFFHLAASSIISFEWIDMIFHSNSITIVWKSWNKRREEHLEKIFINLLYLCECFKENISKMFVCFFVMQWKRGWKKKFQFVFV